VPCGATGGACGRGLGGCCPAAVACQLRGPTCFRGLGRRGFDGLKGSHKRQGRAGHVRSPPSPPHAAAVALTAQRPRADLPPQGPPVGALLRPRRPPHAPASRARGARGGGREGQGAQRGGGAGGAGAVQHQIHPGRRWGAVWACRRGAARFPAGGAVRLLGAGRASALQPLASARRRCRARARARTHAGGKVWCDGEDLYPRKLLEGGDGPAATWRCICSKGIGWSDSLQIYPDCPPDHQACVTSPPAV
jgi:hypothetical protein